MKKFLFLFIIFFEINLVSCLINRNEASQSNLIYNDTLSRPKNIMEHAYLYKEIEGTRIRNYFWVEFAGLVDSINEILKLNIYNGNGIFLYSNYLAVLNETKSVYIDTLNYQIFGGIPSDAIILINTLNKRYETISFFYPEKIWEIYNPFSEEKESFNEIRIITENHINPSYSDYTLDGELYIKVNQIDSIYNVIITLDMKNFERRTYRLENFENLISSMPKFPFQFKYYNSDNKRIYLLDKGYYLEFVK